MARLRFKNFSDLAFIQSIDKPRCLRPLLSQFADYFLRQGIDVTTLTNSDTTDKKLRAVFTQEEIPPELLERLYMLDDVSDEPDHDRILAEADRSGIALNGIGNDLNPGEFAIAVYLQRPDLILRCYEKTIYRKIKNYHEFQAVQDKKLSLSAARSKQSQLEKKLGLWFKKMDRSEFCEVYVYQEDHDIKFQITHGRTNRTDGTIGKNLKRSRIAYRPQKHDSVVFDNRTCILRVNGETPGEKDEYRRAIGEVIFGNPKYFPAGNMYTLNPLKRPDFELKITPGIESARLTETWIMVDDEDRFLHKSTAVDVLARSKRSGNPNLAEGSIMRASFLIKYSSGGRARKLEIRPSNVAIYDRDRDGAPAERFMSANGLLKLDLINGEQ